MGGAEAGADPVVAVVTGLGILRLSPETTARWRGSAGVQGLHHEGGSPAWAGILRLVFLR